MKDAAFEEKYSKLNPRQREAVDCIDGPVMVIAGPGTGKTTILTLRIANILRTTDTPPSGILAITYTEAGVKAMRMKLREVIGSRADEVRVHTFHSFAASVIGEFPDHFTHLSRSKQMTEVETEELVRYVLKDKEFSTLRPLGDPDFYVKKIIGAISDAKREAWSPEIIAAHAKEEIERIKNAEDSISTRGETKGRIKGTAQKRIEKCEKTIIFASAYAAYEKAKRDRKKMDFDDLIFELLLALGRDELLLRLLQEKFLYILVDEHQDTNDSQNLIIKLLADFFDEPNLFVVGDEKQAIYRFQGASVDNFLRFKDVWKSMKIIPLVNNYRSHQDILDASFSMIEHNYEDKALADLRTPLVADSHEERKPVDIIYSGNVLAAEAFLVQELKNDVADEHIESVAVIVRTNRDLERVLSSVEGENLPVASERGADIFSHPVGVLFFELITFLADPSQAESLAKTVAGGLWTLSFEERVGIIRKIRSGAFKEIEESMPELSLIRKGETKSGALSHILRAAEISGLVRLAAKDPLSVEVWRTIVVLSQSIVARDSIEDVRKLIEMLLAYQTSAESKYVKTSVGTSDAKIRIMTAHGSKGLEFDKVYVMYATEESWMREARGSFFVMPREKGDEDSIKDSRRLFYVALTRARRHLSILCPALTVEGKVSTPLRFIDELDQAHISSVSVPALKEAVFAASAKTFDVRQKREIVDYAQRSLLENGLSVTALNHFLTCPSQFIYKSVLKIPEPPQASSEKGTAMHEAISTIWQEKVKDEKSIAKLLASSITDYFASSLLPAFEKEAALKELLETIPAVARALFPHFNLSGQVSTESWKETAFQAAYEGKAFSIRLHGKLDAIIDTGTEALVFDYKTREAMSEAAIKGETQNSLGEYFRQLVFYKLLLEKDPSCKGKSIVPALVFIKPDKKGRCQTVSLPIEKADIEKVEGEIRNLVDSVWSGRIITDVCDDSACPWCALKKF